MSTVNTGTGTSTGLRGYDFSAAIGRPGTWDFFIMRHGESQGNRDKIIQGHANLHLTDEGRRHAVAAGEWFRKQVPDIILASPLSRAWETASIVAGAVNFPEDRIQATDDLKEIDTGIFTGRKAVELATEFPELWGRFGSESWEVVEGAERIPGLEARAVRIWNRLCALARGGIRPATEVDDQGNGGNGTGSTGGREVKSVLCVSHGGMMQWLIRTTFASGWGSWMPVMKIGNCGIFQLRVEVADPDSTAPRMPGADPATSGFSTEWKLFNFLPYSG